MNLLVISFFFIKFPTELRGQFLQLSVDISPFSETSGAEELPTEFFRELSIALFMLHGILHIAPELHKSGEITFIVCH